MLCVFTIGVFRLQNIYDEKSILIRVIKHIHDCEVTSNFFPIGVSSQKKIVDFLIVKKKDERRNNAKYIVIYFIAPDYHAFFGKSSPLTE